MAVHPQHNIEKSPSLGFVEMRRASHSSSCYSTHSHDEFSLGFIDQGEAVYKNQSWNHRIGQGVAVTINPGDAHACNPKEGSWSYRMLFIDSRWLGDLQAEWFDSPNQDYWSFKDQYQEAGCINQKQFNELYQALQQPNNALTAESLLIEFCQNLFEQPVKQKTKASGKKLQRVQERIMDSLEQNLALEDYCQLVDLSPHHLIRSFKQEFGQTPHAYQLDQRIKRARLLLKQGCRLADIASSLGFADQSHFQRNFKKRTAITPRQYQKFFI